MLSIDLLLAVCLGYVALLFALAFYVDRRARQGHARWIQSPIVFTLSISVYCTSWTFYGAVGSAARNGLEFITIYLGPTLVFIGWWWLLRKLVRIGKVHRITSIADLISSRYGKSSSLAVVVTLMALMATTPYIALQLQSVTRSYQAIVGEVDLTLSALVIAGGMALFAILFGTRNVDANERHHGVVAAIAVEAVVKLAALLAVGLFVVFGVAGGVGSVFENIDTDVIYGAGNIFDARWVTLTFLSATAIICLPRQFQVTVVENVDERHLATASWLFPLYLFGMCLFVMPIAIAGLKFLPAGRQPGPLRAHLAAIARARRPGPACFPRWVFIGHVDGHRRRDRGFDDGIESHCGSDFAVSVARSPRSQWRCAQDTTDVATRQYCRSRRSRIPVFPG